MPHINHFSSYLIIFLNKNIAINIIINHLPLCNILIKKTSLRIRGEEIQKASNSKSFLSSLNNQIEKLVNERSGGKLVEIVIGLRTLRGSHQKQRRFAAEERDGERK